MREALVRLARGMADLRILKANYNAKLQKYFIVAVDRNTKIKKTWAIPATDVWPSSVEGKAQSKVKEELTPRPDAREEASLIGA